MAISRLNTLLAIMLAALMWGCGRSSSNDDSSANVELSPEEAIATILDADVQFDECSLNEFAHISSKNEQIDTEQLAYMLKQCLATTQHIEQALLSIKDNEQPENVPTAVAELKNEQWFGDYQSVCRFITESPLPEQFNDVKSELTERVKRINDELNTYPPNEQ